MNTAAKITITAVLAVAGGWAVASRVHNGEWKGMFKPRHTRELEEFQANVQKYVKTHPQCYFSQAVNADGLKAK